MLKTGRTVPVFLLLNSCCLEIKNFTDLDQPNRALENPESLFGEISEQPSLISAFANAAQACSRELPYERLGDAGLEFSFRPPWVLKGQPRSQALSSQVAKRERFKLFMTPQAFSAFIVIKYCQQAMSTSNEIYRFRDFFFHMLFI